MTRNKPSYATELADFSPQVQPVAIALKNEPQAAAPVGGGSDTPRTPAAAPAARKRAAAPHKPKPKDEKRAAEPEPKRVYPWEEADPRVPKVFNLRFDEVAWTKLKYLGDTTYNETMHSIAMAAVKAEIDRRLKAQGVELG